MFANLGIRGRLFAGFAGVLATFLIVAIIVYANLRSAVQNNKWTAHTYEVMLEADAILTSLINIETGQRGYLLAGRDEFLEPLRNGKTEFTKHFEAAKKLTSDNAGQQARLSTLRSEYESWVTGVVEAEVAARRAIGNGADLTPIVEATRAAKGKTGMDGMRRILAEFRQEEAGLLDDRAAALNSVQSTTEFSLVLGILIAVAVGVAVSLYIARDLIAQLGGEPSYAAGVAREIAEGNLRGNIDVPAGDTRSLLAAMRNMRDQLRDLVGNIQRNASQVQHSAAGLSTSATELTQASGTQSESASSMAAAVEEVTVSIGHVSESADEAQRLSRESGEVSREGGTIITRAVNEIAEIAASAQTTSASITALGEHSKQISAVIQVIKEVADQTNLLALNAAIEAARAGEQGRGFAVVADEVRKLAERTTQSTLQISEVIEKVQSGTDVAVEQMSVMVQRVESGQVLAQQAGERIEAIQDSVNHVVTAINQISSALREQSAASHSIAGHVESIAQMSEENSATAKGTSSSASELERMAKDMSTLANRFKV
ncbi:MAG: methyl-accepting chemotaxis protein [Rhodocyclaceae bacterium]